MPASRRIPTQTAYLAVAAASAVGLGLGAGVVSVFVNPARLAARAQVPVATASSEPPAASTRPSATAAAPPSASAAPAVVDPADAGGPADAGDDAGTAPAPAEAAAGDLEADEGLLTVQFDGQAHVWVHGKKIGPTNQANRTLCGQRWTRVGKEIKDGAGQPVPQWLSPGLSVVIECGKPTTTKLPKNE